MNKHSQRLWPLAIVTLSLVFLTGCSPRVQYVPEGTAPERLKEGDPAPFTGWLITDGTLIRLYRLAREGSVGE